VGETLTILSARDVEAYLVDGSLAIDPFEFSHETPPASIDLHISARVVTYSFPGNRYTLGFEPAEGGDEPEEFNAEQVGSGLVS
jgi:hypothetical protein